MSQIMTLVNNQVAWVSIDITSSDCVYAVWYPNSRINIIAIALIFNRQRELEEDINSYYQISISIIKINWLTSV